MKSNRPGLGLLKISQARLMPIKAWPDLSYSHPQVRAILRHQGGTTKNLMCGSKLFVAAVISTNINYFCTSIVILQGVKQSSNLMNVEKVNLTLQLYCRVYLRSLLFMYGPLLIFPNVMLSFYFSDACTHIQLDQIRFT